MLIPAAGAAGGARLGRGKRTLARLAVGYATAAAVALAVLRGRMPAAGALAEWVAVPAQLLALGLALTALVEQRHSTGPRRQAWALLVAYCALGVGATFVWNVLRPRGTGPVFSYADVMYLADFWLLMAAYAAFVSVLGGSFRSLRLWVDMGAVLVAVLAAFWAVLFNTVPAVQAHDFPTPFIWAYVLTLAALMATAAALWVRLSELRQQRPLVLLIAAGLVNAIWEIVWLAGWLTDTDYVGPYYNFGDVVCCTLIACAAAATYPTPGPTAAGSRPEPSGDTFVPTLAGLLAIALIGGSLARAHATGAWVLVGLVMLCSLLLIVRQRAVRRELAELQRALAIREADARTTELVRQSADLFLVVNGDGLIAYASPAAGQLTNTPAAELLGTYATALFGNGHADALAGFLRDLAVATAAPRSIELAVSREGPARALRITGANQLLNPYIDGITLAITDVTEQRALEREVLDAGNRERVRLAGDIHDGLGQELTGIALLLHGLAASERIGDEQRTTLRTIVGHLSHAINVARALARGLSPLYVVGGSLRSALQRLTEDSSHRQPVEVTVDPAFEDEFVADTAADHLFRIAQEAVHNAVKHSGSPRIYVTLDVEERELVLAISDEGNGGDAKLSPQGGLGMRLMKYRARVIGGTLTVDRHAGRGTRVQVAAPLRALGRARS